MELTSKRVIKELLNKYNAKPEKYLGQHFILSKNALKNMINAAEIPHPLKKGGGLSDIIIEIGPGLGTLTQELLKTGANIIAIEKDPLMIKILKETVANHKNIKIIQADARQLSLPLSGVGHRVKSGKVVNKYKIVANLPYNAATFLIREWLESKNQPQMMVLMIQKEVARRIVAKPPRSNLLAISVQFYADAEIIDYVKKDSFWPKPKVDAAIIKIVPKRKIPHPFSKGGGQKTRNAFFAVVKAGFSQPRKQLANNLSNKLKVSREELTLIFRNLDISEKTRAENLNLEQWQNLASRLIHN